MAAEPDNLGDRLRRLERDVAALQAREEQTRAKVTLFDDMAEYIFTPAILLLAGHGHREPLVDMFQRAVEAHAAREQLAEADRNAGVDLLQEWQSRILRQPEWDAPLFPDRHPDLFP